MTRLGLAALVAAITVAALADLLLWLRHQRAHQQPPTVAETVAQLRVRKTREADRDPETTQVIRP
ncbi:hypothetical protein [Saccharopolyspora sp. ASAGF58]|uniref:hypothetical protein n=1 Tax=Saccharopolyspora sp. ASAGF58 TaxID=2719023 RepID=UPI00143FBA12|nr:hypothetical protein [Saccharopolyspora sp. ASAGF58]QIZ37933.1 hypothetical protein FDZ84_29415 [Saccharopolyspora sp. ASAGF58]